MKKLYLIITTASLGLAINFLEAKESMPAQENITMMGSNPYTFSPRLFTAEDKSTGSYWKGDGTKKYPGKAFLGEIEYTKVIGIEKSHINTKENKRRRKNKQYLGSYRDTQTNKIVYLYGMKKVADKVNENPDADVLTEIAKIEDYGPGE